MSDGEDEISQARKLSNGEYEIVLSPRGSNLSKLRHEFYHVADGHCYKSGKGNSGLNNTLTYLFWYEPQARIYQTKGLKP